MNKQRVSILDQLKNSIDFRERIYIKAHSIFILDPTLFNAMIAVISFHAMCEWLVAEGKTTWKYLLGNSNEIRIIKSLSNHFKHMEETLNPEKPIHKTSSEDTFITPDGDYNFGSFTIYSDLKTEKGMNDGSNDLEFLLESADNFLFEILYGIRQ